MRDASVHTKPPAGGAELPLPELRRAVRSHGQRPLRVLRRGGLRRPFRLDRRVDRPVRAEARPPALTGNVQEVGHRLADDLPSRSCRPAGPSCCATIRRPPTKPSPPASSSSTASSTPRGPTCDLTPVRPYVSDGLFDYLQYWISAYKAQGLRNVLEGMRIDDVDPAKSSATAGTTPLTFRIWGTGRDSTVRVADRRSRRRRSAARPRLLRVLDADPRRRRPGAPRDRQDLPQLRRRARHQHGRPVRPLRRQDHQRRVRLGAVEDRAGRLVYGVGGCGGRKKKKAGGTPALPGSLASLVCLQGERASPRRAGLLSQAPWERWRPAGLFFPSPMISSPPTMTETPSPWRSRGYLPHFDQPRLVQAITFRLHDAVPDSVVETWQRELDWNESLPVSDPRRAELRKRISRYEDSGHGACWLRDDRVAALVEGALLHFDEQRYRLIAWCVMPNHVHALIEAQENWPLALIMHSWKSYTSHAANKILQRSGDFWFREYFDRFIRDDRHFARAVHYIEENPVKAALVRTREAWRWSSAWWKGV